MLQITAFDRFVEKLPPEDRWFCSVIDRAVRDASLIDALREEVLATPHVARSILLRHLDQLEAHPIVVARQTLDCLGGSDGRR